MLPNPRDRKGRWCAQRARCLVLGPFKERVSHAVPRIGDTESHSSKQRFPTMIDC